MKKGVMSSTEPPVPRGLTFWTSSYRLTLGKPHLLLLISPPRTWKGILIWILQIARRQRFYVWIYISYRWILIPPRDLQFPFCKKKKKGRELEKRLVPPWMLQGNNPRLYLASGAEWDQPLRHCPPENLTLTSAPVPLFWVWNWHLSFPAFKLPK